MAAYRHFTTCTTAEELKETYRRLCKQWHPDLNPDPRAAETMKEINAEYDEVWPKLKDRHRSQKGETYTAKEQTQERPEIFRAVIMAAVHMENVTIEICGRWLWISGETRPYKDILKALGCRWAPKKAAWYYHAPGEWSPSRGRASMDDIRSFYGSVIIPLEEQEKMA